MNRFTKIAVSGTAAAAVSFGALELMTNAMAEKPADVQACVNVLGPMVVKTAVVPKACQTFEDVFSSKTTTVDIYKETGGVATKSVTEYDLPASAAFKKSEMAYVRSGDRLNDFVSYSAPVIGGLVIGGFVASVTKPSKSEAEPASQITTSEV